MSPEACLHRYHPHRMVVPPVFCSRNSFPISNIRNPIERPTPSLRKRMLIMVASPPTSTTITRTRLPASAAALSSPPPLDLTEDSVMQVLLEARAELGQIFDTSVGMTGKVELAELDGPFVKIRLKGRFWHKRSTVLARVGNYLKQRIPEILEVDIEDEKQLDDSPENF
ncbi:uncharacterized protein LOC122275668 [Carya illinoinensis]|uniref:Uncharacterized protein n=1 Tax=Carya illinoinensis TaxID=32201 RepID=A0A8T1PHM2_CARIL|nr:uncharacterized protein LOC122275668 [Carya illinoinensis]XP_042940753.1 uncharacterized protein LOC122275668 [Carya illinoinensis]XP_042940754.1 uncharacterized protein LOC122275668 [Carya illinoinensis]KAG6640656.1 hypothetical protein CIPAW_09G019400 [Carya illinoinensis]KAG6640657.1 hypothetical protein CIPAW_09G019400 [Carya illinoinensis]